MSSFYALVSSAECWGIQIVTIRYFNSFDFFWDTLYIPQNQLNKYILCPGISLTKPPWSCFKSVKSCFKSGVKPTFEVFNLYISLYTGGLIFGVVRVLVNRWAYTRGGLYSEVCGIYVIYVYMIVVFIQLVYKNVWKMSLNCYESKIYMYRNGVKV